MGSQDRTPPDVERLEPRLTLSTIPPLRQQARGAIDHASHADVAAETREVQPPAPLRARSADPEPDPAPARRSRFLQRLASYETTHATGMSGHGSSAAPHAATTAQAGQVAFAADHDPAHFVLVPASQASLDPYSVSAGAHSGPGMAMGPGGMPSRVAVAMPMSHQAGAMPRMTPTRDARPVETHVDLEPGTMEAVGEEGEPHGHDLDLDLDPGLEPDLSPWPGLEISPAMALPDVPMTELAPVRFHDPETPAPASAQADIAHRGGRVPAGRDADDAFPRVLALSGVAANFHGNLASGRLAPDDQPEPPAVVAWNLRSRLRSLIRRLYAALRRRPRDPEALSGER